MSWFSVAIGCACAIVSTALAADVVDVKSFIPPTNVAAFVVENFDLSTIRSSFGPRRPGGQRMFFKNFGMKPSEVSSDKAIFNDDYWFYEIDVLRVADVNDDGFTDVAVCFLDQALQGTYLTRTPYVLTRYSSDAPLVALSYEPDFDSCRAYKREP